MKNQGEIISLIVFVILTLALGVTTYFGFDKSAVTKAELESATSELANATESADALAANLAVVKTRAGFLPEDKGADIVAAMSADVATALGAGSENLSYKDAVAQLQKNISTLDKQISDVVADRDQQIKNANASVALAVQQQTKYAANVDAQQKAQETAQTDARQNYDKLTQDFVDQTKRFDSVSRQARDAIQTANAESQENRDVATRYANINIDLSKRIDELSSSDFSKEDARVVYVDQVSKIVRLNVGTAQGVRPLMEFNVYPYDAFLQGQKVSKGKLQVIRTIQEDVCEAKIISDDNGSPVQPGDLVYTSLWARGDVMRYALSLGLDVNSDGWNESPPIWIQFFAPKAKEPNTRFASSSTTEPARSTQRMDFVNSRFRRIMQITNMPATPRATAISCFTNASLFDDATTARLSVERKNAIISISKACCFMDRSAPT